MSSLTPIDTLLSRFATMPGRVAQAIEGRSEEELRTKPTQNGWSMVEVFVHS